MDNYLVVATTERLPETLRLYLDSKRNGIKNIRHVGPAAIEFTCGDDLKEVAKLLKPQFYPQEAVELFDFEGKYIKIAGTKAVQQEPTGLPKFLRQ